MGMTTDLVRMISVDCPKSFKTVSIIAMFDGSPIKP